MIDWPDAPEWAEWCSTDGNGVWWWFESEPVWDGIEWYAECQFEKAFVNHTYDDLPHEKVSRKPPSPAELNTMDCKGGQ